MMKAVSRPRLSKYYPGWVHVRNSIAMAMILLGTASMASAAELAVLQNGFTIRHERREAIGDTTRLYTGDSADNFIDVPTAQISSYAPDDTPKQPAVEATKADVKSILKDAGAKHGVDPDFIASVVHAESGYNAHAVSPKGARGLMQLMPKTAEQLGVKDSFDPEANVDGGTQYLRALLDQYNGDVAKTLAAYNAGAKRVAQYHGVPPYRETHAYVVRIINEYNRKKAAAARAAKAQTQIAAKNVVTSHTTASQ
jgi:soluble lytic murein transglycosylase-like protein